MKQKVLLILGASSECGLQLLKQIHKEYSCIYAHYSHHAEELMELKKEVGDKLILVQDNFLEKQGGEKVLNVIEENNVYPDHIIHLSALPYRNDKFVKVGWEPFENNIRVSVHSVVVILQKLINKIIKERRQGKIIFMLSSYTNNIPPKFSSVYVTSKYALLGLMKALSAEYADRGIMVNAVSPSMMETKFLIEVPEFIVQQEAEKSTFGRNLLVEEVVPTFSFLLSDKADRITGQNIIISGGNV